MMMKNKKTFLNLIVVMLLIEYEVFAATNPTECGKRINKIRVERSNKIVNGQRADPQDWGWQVLVEYFTAISNSLCGGSLINSQWVLTAAHCVYSEKSLIVPEPSYFTIYLGLHDIANPEPGSIAIMASKIIINPKYDGLLYDIALIKLREPVKFTNQILPVCLPESNSKFSNKMAWATGWGALFGGGPISNYLMEVNIPIHNDSFCTEYFLNFNLTFNTENSICGGGNNKGTCQGDSGGPLVVEDGGKWKLAGITSYGLVGCKSAIIFVKTSFFNDWIMQTLESNCLKI